MGWDKKYLTKDEYLNLSGENIPSGFNSSEYKAEMLIDSLTFGRLKNKETKDIPTEVKMCIVELINNQGEESDSNIVSESVGNYSYTKSSKSERLKDNVQIIKNYLSNVEIDDISILYPGADIK